MSKGGFVEWARWAIVLTETFSRPYSNTIVFYSYRVWWRRSWLQDCLGLLNPIANVRAIIFDPVRAIMHVGPTYVLIFSLYRWYYQLGLGLLIIWTFSAENERIYTRAGRAQTRSVTYNHLWPSSHTMNVFKMFILHVRSIHCISFSRLWLVERALTFYRKSLRGTPVLVRWTSFFTVGWWTTSVVSLFRTSNNCSRSTYQSRQTPTPYVKHTIIFDQVRTKCTFPYCWSYPNVFLWSIHYIIFRRL